VLGEIRPPIPTTRQLGSSSSVGRRFGVGRPGRGGAAVGYPGIVLDEHGGEVRGLLFSSEGLAEHWARLDEFEGEGYERVLTTVRLEDGTAVKAYIYRLSGSDSPAESDSAE